MLRIILGYQVKKEQLVPNWASVEAPWYGSHPTFYGEDLIHWDKTLDNPEFYVVGDCIYTLQNDGYEESFGFESLDWPLDVRQESEDDIEFIKKDYFLLTGQNEVPHDVHLSYYFVRE